MALEYQDATGVRVVPVLKSGLEYLEAVNDASIAEESMPDVYLISNDGLEKAYLAGLAVNVKDQNAVLNTENFPQTALDAVTYQGHAVAYPLYFETSALVYNQTYLEQAAAELETDEASLIPKTIDDIRNFADEYNAPETVESVFRWDVSDFSIIISLQEIISPLAEAAGMIRPGSTSIIRMRFTGLRRTRS